MTVFFIHKNIKNEGERKRGRTTQKWLYRELIKFYFFQKMIKNMSFGENFFEQNGVEIL